MSVRLVSEIAGLRVNPQCAMLILSSFTFLGERVGVGLEVSLAVVGTGLGGHGLERSA
jgi:hypothetical protein